MADKVPIGFFAHPSVPHAIGEVVRGAVSEINSSSVARITPWETMTIGGKFLIEEICKQISQADFMCADITDLNPNVMFELGFAIGANKRVWLTMDATMSNAVEEFKQMRILTTVGYVSSVNVQNLTAEFYREQPYADITNTIFASAIQLSLGNDNGNTNLLYMKTRHDTEASRHVTRRIEASPISKMIDDPRESSVQTLAWYGQQVFNSVGVICHLTPPQREGARLHNARYALVAGMAYGMDKQLLLLTEGDYLAPIDYRDMLRSYRTATEAGSHVDRWLQAIELEWLKKRSSVDSYASSVRLATELKLLNIGEYVAENEAEGLTDHYFVETTSYDETIKGNINIFIGRKGTGKSANLIKAASKLRQDKRNLVCVIKPEGYELQGVVKLLTGYHEKDLKGYAIQSLWKFLIYSEIANEIARQVETRQIPTNDQNEQRLLQLLERNDGMLKQDFSVRLERCVDSLSSDNQSAERHESIERSRIAISERLHDSLISDIRKVLGELLADKQRVAILIDNLDKAWDRQTVVDDLSVLLLSLLGFADKITSDLRSTNSRYKGIRATLAIFLRADIYYKIMSVAREPDKITVAKIDWNDPELLLRVVEERFRAGHANNIEPQELWSRFFCETVAELATKDYFLDRILPRPRDLLYFVKAALSIAVNRKHSKVQPDDVTEAEKEYSQYALDSILVENGMTVPQLEGVIYEFIGCPSRVSDDDIPLFLNSAGIDPTQHQYVVERLCALSFLGLEVANGDFRFVKDQDPQDYKRNEVLARRLLSKRGGTQQYMINKPFWAFLEVVKQ